MNTDVLFRPFTHPKLDLPNRIAMAPMTRQFSPQGIPDAAVCDYYKRRAEGEVGLIITEGTTVPHPAASSHIQIPKFHDESLEGWAKVVETVHAAGSKIAPQLWHVGVIRKPGQGPCPDYQTVSPSGYLRPEKKVLQPLSTAEIDQIIQAFTQSAANAKQLGFDALELHGAHGYLIDNFFWEGTNVREDEYGGSLVKRTRFATAIVESIRAEIGEDFPIILRFSQWKQQDYEAKLATPKWSWSNFSRLCQMPALIFFTAAPVASGNPNSMIHRLIWPVGSNRLPANRLSAWAVWGCPKNS